MLRSTQLCVVFQTLTILTISSSSAFAVNIAVIDTDSNEPSLAEIYCNRFEKNGHSCTAFPISGPTSSLDPFDVVVNLSEVWSDPDKLLVQHLHKGKGVITWLAAPLALGINTDPVVQAWIGANENTADFDSLLTVATDPILGNTPVGTEIGNCGDAACGSLKDISGHPNAKILSEYQGLGNIGMLRNTWQGGESVYISDGVEDFDSFLRAIEILGNPIPAVSTWGLVVMTVTFLIIGTILIRHRKVLNPSC